MSTTSDFTHKKSLGQNFLTSRVVPEQMCEAALIKAGDVVLEIGPGTGALTKVLLEKGALVYALEADQRAIAVLEIEFSKEIAEKRLILIHGDARELDLAAQQFTKKPYKIVANIPYYLSGYLLRICLGSQNPPATLVFLMQKEVVERIARAKKSSLLSISVAVFGIAKYVKTVGRGHFSPPPKVDSAILLVSDISNANLPTKEINRRFFTHLHIGYGQKRKQLLGNLAAYYDREELGTLFTKLSLPPTIRAEDIGAAKWLALDAELATLSPHTTLPIPE